jgi:hypothetical protein
VGDAGGPGAVKKRLVQAAWMVGGGVGTALPNLPVLEGQAVPLRGAGSGAPWLQLVFPVWVLVVSINIVVLSYRNAS